MENEIKEQNYNVSNWLEQEEKELTSQGSSQVLPSLKFEENKIIGFVVDFSKPFQKWTGSGGRGNLGQVTKAIIPVMDLKDNITKNLWLNVKNPLYAEIVQRGKKGQTMFKVIQTGKQATTKYSIVE